MIYSQKTDSKSRHVAVSYPIHIVKLGVIFMNQIDHFLTSDAELAKTHVQRLKFSPKEIIYTNEKVHLRNNFVLIKDGIVSLELYHKGKWQFTTFLTPGDCAGIDNFLTPKKTNYTPSKFKLTGATNGEIISVEKDYFLNHFYANPKLFTIILEKLALHYMYASYNSHEKNARLCQRMADVTLEFIALTDFRVNENTVIFPYPISAKMFSTYLKAPLSAVSEVLRMWEEENILISTSDNLLITDYKKLLSFSKMTYLIDEVLV